MKILRHSGVGRNPVGRPWPPLIGGHGPPYSWTPASAGVTGLLLHGLVITHKREDSQPVGSGESRRTRMNRPAKRGNGCLRQRPRKGVVRFAHRHLTKPRTTAISRHHAISTCPELGPDRLLVQLAQVGHRNGIPELYGLRRHQTSLALLHKLDELFLGD